MTTAPLEPTPGGVPLALLQPIHAALGEVLSLGRARLLPLAGPPGSGRTWLAMAAARLLADLLEGLVTWRAALGEAPAERAAGAAGAIARARFGLDPGTGRAAAEERIAAALADLVEPDRAERAARDLAALADAARPDGADVDPAVCRRAVGTLRNLLRHDAHRAPHVLVLDDLDRVPADGLPLVREVLARLRDGRALVLAVTTDGGSPPGAPNAAALAAAVAPDGAALAPVFTPPWTAERLGRLLDEALAGALGPPGPALPAGLRDEALRLAAGRPGRLTALVAAAGDAGLLRPAGGAAPPLLRAGWARAAVRVWRGELDALDADPRRVLARAAVLGERFPADLLLAVAEEPDGDVLRAWSPEGLGGSAAAAVALLVRRGLLVEGAPGGAGGETLALADPLLRTAAAEGQGDDERTATHARAARWWEAHAAQPGDHVRTATHASAAGCDLLAAAAWELAAGDPAVPLAERAARAERGRVKAEGAGGLAVARLALAAGAARLQAAELAEAENEARDALRALRPLRARAAAADAHALLARVLAERGDLAGAAELAGRAQGLLAEAGAAPGAASWRALARVAETTLDRGAAGAVSAALRLAERARAAAAGAPPLAAAEVERVVARARLAAADFAAAADALDRADASLEAEDDRALVAAAAAVHAELLLARGRPERAAAVLRAGLAAAELSGARLAALRLRALQAVAAAAAGEPDGHTAAAAETAAEGIGARYLAAEARLLRARAALLRGALEEARAHAVAAAVAADEVGALGLGARARSVEAVARQRSAPADPTAADALSAEAARRLEEADDALGLLLWATGVPPTDGAAEAQGESSATRPMERLGPGDDGAISPA